MKHPEMIHTDLFTNVPTWPEPDVSGNNNLLAKNAEAVESEVDPKLFDGSDLGPGFDVGDFDNSLLNKKVGKIELTIKGENEVYPKDAPYTQGVSGLKLSSSNLACLTLLVWLTYLVV